MCVCVCVCVCVHPTDYANAIEIQHSFQPHLPHPSCQAEAALKIWALWRTGRATRKNGVTDESDAHVAPLACERISNDVPDTKREMMTKEAQVSQ